MHHQSDPDYQTNQRPSGTRSNFIRRTKEVEKNYPILEVAHKLGLHILEGNRLNCISPSHTSDRSASMTLDPVTNECKCYACGARGTNIQMVRWILEVTPQKAMDLITGRSDYPVNYRKEYKQIKTTETEDDMEQPVIHLTTQVLKKINTNVRPTPMRPGDHAKPDELHPRYPQENRPARKPEHHSPAVTGRTESPARPMPDEPGRRRPMERTHAPEPSKVPPGHFEKSEPKQDQKSIRRNQLFDTGLIFAIYKEFYTHVQPIAQLKMRLRFLSDFGINQPTLQKMNVGYIADYHELDYALRKKFTVDDLVAAGVFGPLIDDEGEKKTGLSFYYHKIIFPFYSGKNIIFLQGRRLNNEDPIFLNTTKNASMLYNFSLLREIKPKQKLFITEGVLPTLALLERGLSAVGLVELDTWKKDWLEYLKPLQVILAFDTDQSGSYLTKRMGNYFLKAEIDCKKAQLQKILLNPNDQSVYEPLYSKGEKIFDYLT